MQDQIEQIDIKIEEAKKAIDKADALDRLVKNKDFQLIVDHGYFVEEASNLVLLLATPNFAGETEQTRLNKHINAIGCLRQYFSSIMQLGTQSLKAVRDHEEMKQEILTEEAT